MLDTYLFYPGFALLTIVMALLIIPKHLYKKCFLYGFLLGGLGDTLIALALSALHLIEYKNMGPFSLFGVFSF